MTLKDLQTEMVAAMKNKNKLRKDVISSMISGVKKAAIDKGCRDDIPEDLISEVILKEKKTMQEMIDTCPADRADTLEEYKAKMEVIEEFAPRLITDEGEIREFILGLGIGVSKENRGSIMKQLKGKVDMKTANKVLGELM